MEIILLQQFRIYLILLVSLSRASQGNHFFFLFTRLSFYVVTISDPI